jgi:Ca-activated chloride channel family protein
MRPLRSISAVCLLAGLSLMPLRVATQAPVFRGAIDLVPVAVTVFDRKGAPVTGLTAADFEVWEDGRQQALSYFATGAATSDAALNPALHLGVLLDFSESMVDDVAFTRTAAIKFLNMLVHAVDVTVVDFDTEVRTSRYGQADFARLVERIRRQKVQGMTALYDAIGVAVDGVTGLEGRKVMLLYTDGGDTRSALGRGELMNLLKASDVTIYAIGAMAHPGAVSSTEARQLLREIASITGGQAFFPRSVKEIEGLYAQIVAEIGAQYTLGYSSTNNATDGSWRKIQVKLTAERGKDLRLRTRAGYFAVMKK